MTQPTLFDRLDLLHLDLLHLNLVRLGVLRPTVLFVASLLHLGSPTPTLAQNDVDAVAWLSGCWVYIYIYGSVNPLPQMTPVW